MISILTWISWKNLNHRLNLSYCKIFKIRNTNLQFRSPGYGRQRNKKKKNTGEFKAFCLLCKCKSKHQTSICNKLADNKSKLMLVTTETNVTYPIAILKLNGVKFKALAGSGSSYISESFIGLFKINPFRKEYKTKETLINCTTYKLKIYNVKVENLEENFSFQIELNKLERKRESFSLHYQILNTIKW